MPSDLNQLIIDAIKLQINPQIVKLKSMWYKNTENGRHGKNNKIVPNHLDEHLMTVN